MGGVEPFVAVAAALVAILSTARLTRLLTQDVYPPVAWLRGKWDGVTESSDWNILLHCHWCASPWLAAIVGAWGLSTGFQAAWWVVNGWLALSYLAAMVVERDEIVEKNG